MLDDGRPADSEDLGAIGLRMGRLRVKGLCGEHALWLRNPSGTFGAETLAAKGKRPGAFAAAFSAVVAVAGRIAPGGGGLREVYHRARHRPDPVANPPYGCRHTQRR